MRPQTGPSLPSALLEELGSASVHVHTGVRKGNKQKVSRKDARKQDRNEKKQRKAGYFTSSRSQTEHVNPGVKRQAKDEHAESPKHKKPRLAEPSGSKENLSGQKNKTTDTVSKPSLRKDGAPRTEGKQKAQSSKTGKPLSKTKKTDLQKLAERASTGAGHASSSVHIFSEGRREQERDEDAYIAYLEKKLGWSKSGAKTNRYGKGLEEDGLDDLLKDIDTIEASVFSTGKQKGPTEDNGEESWDEESEEDRDDYIGTSEDESEGLPEDGATDEDEEMGGEAEAGSADEEIEWTGFSEAEELPTDGAVTAPKLPVAGTRYVPPHMRHKESDQDSEAQIKLSRQLKGLLNRMSEQNISSILDSLEDTYRNNRRHDVTSKLTSLIVEGISSHSMLLDSYVVLHAAFVASLHKIIGVEFAAYFVQNVVATYERHFTSLSEIEQAKGTQADEETLGKECSNLIVLLSELYNFQVISCMLVYDVIRRLLDGELTEFKVELLLKVTRTSGQQLRTDDPSALKDIIQIVHSKLPAQQNALSSRTRFMVETLTNLKNNKVKKSATASGENDSVERMKKFLSALNKKRHVKSHEPLRVTLDDLHSAESKGKWWLVGAAWGGDPLVDRQETAQVSAKKSDSVENVLLKLAKKQGMNTDIRRSIFVVLMSSEDYVDACERLSQLKLTEVQQREIVRVILHCCGNEKSYNPYYAFVGQQLCRSSHSYKVTLQFWLWDFLRDLGETNVGGMEVLKNLQDGDVAGFNIEKISSSRMRNVARAYAWWLAKDCCTLAIFKPVDFTGLKPQARTFFKELFTHLLISTQLSTPLLSPNPEDHPRTRNRGALEEVFVKATRVQTLAFGLVYFLSEIFEHEAEEEGGSSFLRWATKIAVDTLRTGVDVAAGL